MKRETADGLLEPERYELLQAPAWRLQDAGDALQLDRRDFLQVLGAGLLVSLLPITTAAQERDRRAAETLAQRLHLGADGLITVLCGKVEVGQGSRTQLTMAAAEELHVGLAAVRLLLADTALVPDDGGTHGSRTTPSTVPTVRSACAAARELLIATAARLWKVEASQLTVQEGRVAGGPPDRALAYADLSALEGVDLASQAIGRQIELARVPAWSVLGRSAPRVDGRGIVTGAHRYPSDIVRPGMLHGAVLRPPSYGATLASIDLSAAGASAGIVAVRDDALKEGFIGFAAPTSFAARQARDAVAATAKWQTVPHPSSESLFDLLVETVDRDGAGGGRPSSRSRGTPQEAMAQASRSVRQRYHVAYIQHAPLEPRAAVAEWSERGLTVWTGTQNPSRVRDELAQAFGLPPGRVQVVVPDTGGAFGGKHTGEVAVEAARLAQEAKRPVALQWSREEEFTWAYFRPAGVIEVAAGVGADGRMQAWEQRTWNSGSSALETPYAIAHTFSDSLPSNAPLRQGSYRALAATANTFARESFIDELAAEAGSDPLDYRLQHLEDARLSAVLEQAAERFEWRRRRRETKGDSTRGIGLACGTEKGSYVAACVELRVDPKAGRYRVLEVCEAFECGAVQNPDNLRAQIEGCILQGLGGALREEIRFQDGQIENPRFSRYEVPRFRDVPHLVVVLVDRQDLASAGAGETPIIAVAPAVANALCAATGARIRAMPIRDERFSAE